MWRNGAIYRGDFQDGKRHGYGVWVSSDKNEKYEGYYNNDLKEGKGRYIWKMGVVFDGIFVRDRRYLLLYLSRHGPG